MNNDLYPPSSRGGEEVVADRNDVASLGELLMMALAETPAPPAFNEALAVACAAELTDQDRAALSVLGDPQELAAMVCSKSKAAAPLLSPMAASTHMVASSLDDTRLHGPCAGGEPTPDFEELMKRHEACQSTRFFQWNNQFFRKDEIGHGGQGTVYRIACADQFMGDRALKVMSPQPYCDAPAYYEDMLRMRSVAAVVHQNFQDNLTHVERFEPINGVFVMIMRLIDGLDLLRLLQPDVMDRLEQHVPRERWEFLSKVVFARCGQGRVRLQPGIAVYIIHKCLCGLKALHRNRIVHGDIKPSNIMLDSHGCVRLIDVGSAFQLDAPPRQFALSPRYAPPEVLRGGPWTEQGDFASLGYVLIELLTGRPDLGGPPVTAESGETLGDAALDEHLKVKRDLAKNLKRLLPHPAHDSAALMELCTILVQEDPAKRFENAEAAIACSARFRNQLVVANMAMAWPMDIQYWVSDVKAAMAKDVERR